MRLLLVCLVCSSLLIGCNLSTDLDAYPYRGAIIIDPDDDGITPIDMPQTPDVPADLDLDAAPDLADDMPAPDDMTPDMEPLVVKLRFTEILVSSTANSSSNNDEDGEFIEITNIGTAPVDPALIQITVAANTISVDTTADNAEELEIINGIKPLLPGQSFVFVRADSSVYGIIRGLPLGTFYEYKRWSSNIALSNTTRTISLIYPNPLTKVPEEHDRLSWFSGRLVEVDSEASDFELPLIRNISWSLDPEWYTFGPPSDASDWCYETNKLSGSTLVRGSPGSPLAGPCIRVAADLP
jgi:hypothetical protein